MPKKIVILLFFLLCFFYGIVQTNNELVTTHYSEVNGISSKSVSDILQNKQGYLWLASYEGLIRFDGYSYKTYNNTGFSNSFLKIAEDKKGNIWLVLTNGTLAKFNPANASFTNITINYIGRNSNEKPGTAESIFFDKENNLWLGVTRTGLVKVNTETGDAITYNIIKEGDDFFTAELRKFYNRVLSIYEDAGGILWLATPDGLYNFNKKTLQLNHLTTRPKNNTLWRDDNFRCITKISNKLYIGSWGGGLVIYDIATGGIENYKFNQPQQQSVTSNIIHSIVQKNDSIIYIASPDKGFLSFNILSKKFYYYSNNADYKDIPAWLWTKLLKDNDNNIWALNEIGLMHIQTPDYKFSFHNFTVTHSDNHIFYGLTSAIEDEKLRLVATQFADGLHVFNKLKKTEKIFSVETLPGEEKISSVLQVLKDSKNNRWVITKDYIYQYDEKSETLVKPAQPPLYERQQSNAFIGATEDSLENLWITTARNGVFIYNLNTKQYTHLSTTTDNVQLQVPTNLVSSVVTDVKGRVWLSSNRGFLSYCNKNEYTIQPAQAINAISKNLSDTKIYDLFADSKGFVWVSALNGLFKINCNTATPTFVKKYTVAEGLHSDNVAGLAEDSLGNIWGVEQNIYAVCMIDEKNSKIYNYGIRDGLNHSGDVIKIKKITNNIMWVLGESGGYYEFNPNIVFTGFKNDKPPAVTIMAVNSITKYYEDEISKNGKVILSPGQNSFYFEFSALDFQRPEMYQYAYMLQGFDTAWTYCGSRRAVSYTNIPGGNYIFKVKATTIDGNWGGKEIQIPLYIKTRFYKKWWFLLISSLLLLTGLILLSRYRLKKQRQIMLLETKTQALAKEKTHVQYENLKQHLNPHFLFNSLTSLGSLIRINQQQAIHFLDGMSRIYRYILQQKDEETVALKDEIAFVQTFIQLQSTRLGKGLQFKLNVEDEYLNKKIVPVTLQNLIENAIKHNIIDEETPLIIEIFIEEDYLIIRNNLQRKNFVETSNQQGLENLMSLYDYLSDKEIIITENEKYFIVKIPLI